MNNEKPKKILIIDDDEPIRSLYSEIFRREGFEVEEATDGMDGLEKATKSVPDIIFSGIIMPRMDGFSLKEALSKNANTANIPVVMSSHMGRKEDEIRAREMGIRDFIVLDLMTPREAVQKIKRILDNSIYKIKFNPTELDADRLAHDLSLDSGWKCSKCNSELILNLNVIDLNNQEFNAKFICPNCGK